jgi:hypothetical protein
LLLGIVVAAMAAAAMLLLALSQCWAGTRQRDHVDSPVGAG